MCWSMSSSRLRDAYESRICWLRTSATAADTMRRNVRICSRETSDSVRSSDTDELYHAPYCLLCGSVARGSTVVVWKERRRHSCRATIDFAYLDTGAMLRVTFAD